MTDTREATSEQAWCLGVPATGTRPLDGDEIVWLERSVERARKHVRPFQMLLRASAAMALVGIPPWLSWMASRGKAPLGSLLVYVLLVVPGVLGCVGAIVEAFAAAALVQRLAFAAGLMVLAGSLASGYGSAAFALVFLAGPLVAGVGLWALYRRYQRYGVEREALKDVETDLRAPHAWVFRGAPDHDLDTSSIATQLRQGAANGDVTFHVLPKSHLLVPNPPLKDAVWQRVYVTTTAAVGESVPMAPLPGASALNLREGVELLQRHLRSSEVDEIERQRKNLVRRAALVFLGVGYFAARVAQLAEFALRKSHHGEVSIVGWTVAAFVGAWFAWKPLRLRNILKGAIETRMVIVVRGPNVEGEIVTTQEVLMGTNIVWSELSHPATWRTNRL